MATHLIYVAGRADGVVSTIRFDEVSHHAEVVARTDVGDQPMPLALNTDQRLLRVATGRSEPSIVTLELADDGTTTELQKVSCPVSATYLTITPDESLAVAVCYHDSKIAYATVGDDHLIDESSWQVADTGCQPHCVVTSPDGRDIYVSELGEDHLVGYRRSQGRLVAEETLVTSLPDDSGPRHIVVTPNGQQVYVIEEFGGNVWHFDRVDPTGVLIMKDQMSYVDPAAGLRHGVYVPPDREPTDDEKTDRMWGADIAVNPAKGWIVASERRASTLTLQKLNPDGSFGAQLDQVTTETQPRGIGRIGDDYVIAGAEKGDTATIYRVSKILEPVAQISGLGGPIWMKSISLEG